MPIIKITEEVLPYAASRNTTDIPLILSSITRPTNVDAFPKMYLTVDDFKKTLGDKCSYLDAEDKTFDSAYIIAIQLLSKNMPVYYGFVEDLIDSQYKDNEDNPVFDYILDKNEVTIKYICAPDENTLVFGTNNDGSNRHLKVKDVILDICATRGDCLFISDCRRAFDYKEIFEIQDLLAGDKATSVDVMFKNHEFATAFAPWHNFSLNETFRDSDNNERADADLPGSYAYLSALLEATKSSNNWLAMAGVARGAVPGIGAAKVAKNRIITNTVANKLQPTDTDKMSANKVYFAVNPITNIAPYGSIIWGNRTLKPIKGSNMQPTHFLNTRNMISDIKKVAYDTAKTLMFNQNDEILWLDFLAGVTPFLERLKSGSGIFDYKLIKKTGTQRNKLECEIKIYPVSAVEWFDINIVASDIAVETTEK